VGLSVDRLALVERYMIDAEEAETRAQPAAETQRSARRALEQRPRGEAEELQRARRERAQRDAEELQGAAERAPRRVERVAHTAASTKLHRDEVADEPVRSTAKQEARKWKAFAKAERRAAKHAARVVAAMEKKEARERKALAKAAARREAHARKA
jgi:hypothetical protein